MIVIPGATTFTMGSPESERAPYLAADGLKEWFDHSLPQRAVTIPRKFAVGKYEVTFAQWDACVAAGGCSHKPETQWGRGNQPVMNVSYAQITQQYLPWLNNKTKQTYRLLTEAEWEYAARAGTTTAFSTGDTITTAQANFDGNYTYNGSSKGVGREKTVEVGSLRAPNKFGLHDMHGNVWEWVEDCWHDSYNSAPRDGSRAWKGEDGGNCEQRVLRGGSWYNYPRNLRSAIRYGYTTDNRINFVGFRLARTLP